MENEENAGFCTSCGASLKSAGSSSDFGQATSSQTYDSSQNNNQYNQQYNQRPTYNQNYNSGGYQNDEPITPWGYVGYMFLFSIPCVGIIMMFVYAFGGNTNINLKNFAKGYLYLMGIGIAIYVVFFILMMVFGVSMATLGNNSSF